MSDLKHPEFLYKYLDYDGAFATLNNGTIMLRKPTTFNDPFDMQPAGIIDISTEELRERSAAKVARATKDNSIPLPPPPPFLSVAAATAALEKMQNTSEEELFKQFMKSGDLAGWEQLILEQEADMRIGIENFFVSCFSEEKGNLLMWAHYAKSHAGVMLEYIRRSDGLPGICSQSKKVNYTSNPVPFAPKGDILKFVDDPYNASFDNKHLEIFLTNKSTDWEYEKEWRLMISPDKHRSRNKEDRGFTPFHSSELHGVYLGYCMSEESRKSIVELCKSNFPQAKIYESRKMRGSFKVHYQEIST